MHLISTENLSKEWIETLFDQALKYKSQNHGENHSVKTFEGSFAATLFYEPSTRTRISFEIAAKKLGFEVIHLNPETSSLKKGESLLDTANTLINLGIKLVIIRHPSNGFTEEFASFFNDFDIKVINAGDGSNQHPTQALLDLFTIREELNLSLAQLEGKKIIILGDSLYSRVCRSNIYLLKQFGLEITLVGPKHLIPHDLVSENHLNSSNNLLETLSQGIDLIMVLRLQKERQGKELTRAFMSEEEYIRDFRLSMESLNKSKLDLNKIRILHPGPVNRDVEIDSELVDNQFLSLIDKQVRNGVFVRMAAISSLFA